jgi:hypothetical protein
MVSRRLSYDEAGEIEHSCPRRRAQMLRSKPRRLVGNTIRF